jgi:hypothetical protein
MLGCLPRSMLRFDSRRETNPAPDARFRRLGLVWPGVAPALTFQRRFRGQFQAHPPECLGK